jgi:hypothetical protein
MNDSKTNTQLRTPCQHLRSKEMYYQGHDAQEDAFDSGVYWCLLTHEKLGPDGQSAARNECCEGRGCFQG